MVHIDGSHIEGGGQIIRTALALSALTRKPFQAVNIRQNRPKPGLKHQHLCCINALKQLTNAQVKDIHLGSETIAFIPGKFTPKVLSIDIGTAGSITLLLQSILLPSMFGPGEVRLQIKGGTDTKWSIPIDYFSHIILPFYKDYAAIDIYDVRRGYYPKGQGFIDLNIKPQHPIQNSEGIDAFAHRLQTRVPGIDLVKKPEVFEIRGISAASSVLKRSAVANRQVKGVMEIIGNRYPIKIDETYHSTASIGTVIALWGAVKGGKVSFAASALGEKGLPAEKVGRRAAMALLDVLESDAALGHHLADNLIPLLTLVGGSLKPDKISGHILSNIYVCEQFLNVSFIVDERRNLIRSIWPRNR